MTMSINKKITTVKTVVIISNHGEYAGNKFNAWVINPTIKPTTNHNMTKPTILTIILPTSLKAESISFIYGLSISLPQCGQYLSPCLIFHHSKDILKQPYFNLQLVMVLTDLFYWTLQDYLVWFLFHQVL